MIEIKPWMVDTERFLGILIYFPKCTMRILFNMKIMCLDESFDIAQLEKRCSIPMIGSKSCSFEGMMNQKCKVISHAAKQLGIHEMMTVKEAIACAFQHEK